MSPDSLSSDPLDQVHAISQALYAPYVFGIALLVASLVSVIFALLTVGAAKEHGFKLKYLLVISAALATAAGLAATGVFCLREGGTKTPSEAGNIDVVQEWAASSYGVSVSDGDAKSMAGEMLSRSRRNGRAYTVQSPAGVLEVKLVSAEDGKFHLVQSAAELELPEAGAGNPAAGNVSGAERSGCRA